MGGLEQVADWLGEAWSWRVIPALHGIAAAAFGALFVWSGVSKLEQPEAAGRAISDFGIIGTASRGVGVLAGVVELTLAVVLLLASASSSRTLLVASVVATAGLLAVFAGLIARSLARGERFPCACFGEVDSPLSLRTLVRTSILALIALMLAVGVLTANASRPPGLGAEALIGVAIVAGIALAASTASLLRWNRDLFDSPVPTGLEEVEDE